MNILRWFDSRAVVQFAKAIAQEIKSLSPPDSLFADAGHVRVKEIRKMERIFSRIYTFSLEQKLNIYTKAKLLNTLRWELLEIGYPPSYVNNLIDIITPKL